MHVVRFYFSYDFRNIKVWMLQAKHMMLWWQHPVLQLWYVYLRFYNRPSWKSALQIGATPSARFPGRINKSLEQKHYLATNGDLNFSAIKFKDLLDSNRSFEHWPSLFRVNIFLASLFKPTLSDACLSLEMVAFRAKLSQKPPSHCSIL